MAIDFWEIAQGMAAAFLEEIKKEQLRERELLAKESVTFILGAGVSCPYRLPAWQDLVTEVYLTSRGIDDDDKREVLFKPYKDQICGYFSGNVLRQARYVTSKLDKETLLNTVKRSLYGNCAHVNPYPTFDSLVRWCKSGKKKLAFVTYNYDDLLEQYLKANGVDFTSIYNSDSLGTASENSIPVYHVHGFLPQGAEPDLKQELVLSEQQYNILMTDPQSQDWRNKIQQKLFAETACFFLGISLDDPNTRRLLDLTASVGQIFRVRPKALKEAEYTVGDLEAAIEQADIEKQILVLESMAASAKGRLFMDHVTKKFEVPEHEGFADLDEQLRKKLVDVMLDAPFNHNSIYDDHEFGLTTVFLEHWKDLPGRLDYLLGLC